MNKNAKKKKKGFTLIELIIVLAIMAIIAAIAIPNFSAIRDNSKNKADVQSEETIKRTVLMLVSDGTIKPSTTADLTVSFTDGSAVTATSLASNGKDEFEAAMKEVKKPQGTSKYTNTGADAASSAAAAKYLVTIKQTTGDITVVTTQN